MKAMPRSANLLRISRRAASIQSPLFLLRRSKMPADSSISDTGVEKGVGDVDYEIHEQEQKGKNQDRRLDDEILAIHNGLNNPAADSIPSEDGFREYGP